MRLIYVSMSTFSRVAACRRTCCVISWCLFAGKLLRAEMVRLAFSSSNTAGHFNLENCTLKQIGKLSREHLFLLSEHVHQNAGASRENGIYGHPGAKTIFSLGEEDLNGFADDPLVCVFMCMCVLLVS